VAPSIRRIAYDNTAYRNQKRAQPAVAGHIGSEDGSQPPFDARFGHEYRPDYRDFELSVRSGAKCVY